MSQAWFARIMGSEVGPLSSARIREMARSGQITALDQMRKQDSDEWFPASRIKGLFEQEPIQANDNADGRFSTKPANKPPTLQGPFERTQVKPNSSTADPAIKLGPHAYASQNLVPGERILYASRIHPLIFLLPVAMLLSLLPGGILLSVDNPAATGFAIFFISLGIASPISLIKAAVTFFTTECVLTDKRVLAKTGFIRRDSVELLLKKVEGLQVNQSILGRIFNFGTISVSGTGGSRSNFPGLENPLEFRRRVQEEISKNP
jgi:hypothetical protein